MHMASAQRVVRLTCGLGVFLLLASQEKVCPWLEDVPVQSGRPAAQPDAENPAGESEPAETPPPSLASTLPDVVAPRWPGRVPIPLGPGARRGKPSATTISGSGDCDTGVTIAWSTGAALPAVWEPPLRPWRVPARACAGGQVTWPCQLAFLTTISPTGPPGA